MKQILSVFILFLLLFNANAQDDKLQWINPSSFNWSGELSKPVLVFFHAEWCKYCEGMKNSTFQDSVLIAELNGKFNAIIFNVYHQNSIQIRSREFRSSQDESSYHELVLALLGENQSLPGLVVLNEQKEIVWTYNGYLTANQLIKVLQAI